MPLNGIFLAVKITGQLPVELYQQRRNRRSEMSTWILIVSVLTGVNYGYEYAIPNLPSYQECDRISKLIPLPSYSGGSPKFLCIEVKQK